MMIVIPHSTTLGILIGGDPLVCTLLCTTVPTYLTRYTVVTELSFWSCVKLLLLLCAVRPVA